MHIIIFMFVIAGIYKQPWHSVVDNVLLSKLSFYLNNYI